MLRRAELEAVDGDDALWRAVRRVIAVILRRLDNGERCIFIAPSENPFRPRDIIHMHDYPELFLGVAGMGELILNEGSVPIEPGALTLVPRGIAHREVCLPGRESSANICCSALPHRISSHTMVAEGDSVSCGRFAGFVDSRAARINRYLVDASSAAEKGYLAHDRVMRGLLEAGLGLMAEAIDKRKGVEVSDRLVSRTRMFLDSHICDPLLSVCLIADKLGYSADYLSNRFHTLTGRRLSGLITERRMELSARLLCDQSLNIAEAAHACGYQDPSYFSRLFRQHFGLSPRSWRASQLESAR